MTEPAFPSLIDLLQRPPDPDPPGPSLVQQRKPSLLSSFLQKYSRRRRPHGPPRPTTTHYITGDIHGRADLLEGLLDQITADLAARPTSGAHLVFVGDYVDRGDTSAAVLARLHRLEETGQGRIICLKGNHEAMLLDFLDQPETKGRRWLKNGGLQTLASYGVGGASLTLSGSELAALRTAFAAALPKGMADWLRARPLIWQSGTLAVVHAAVDPALPLAAQSERALLWGHKAFFQTPHRDGGWVAHGHTITDQARATGGRISVDTGAYATQILTCARVTPDGGVAFLQTP